MRTNKFKIRLLLLIPLIVIMSVLAYVYLPDISYAVELENVGKVNTPANSTETKTEIREHRGHSILAYGSSEAVTYEAAAGNTGIKDIDSYLSEHMNDAYDEGQGWYRALKYNTSIYCRENGRTFPDIEAKYLRLFHKGNSVGGKYDANKDHLGAEVIDYVEKYWEIACTHQLTLLAPDWSTGGIEMVTTQVSERDLKFDRDGGKYIQHTLVRLEYDATPKTWDTVEAYTYTNSYMGLL